MQILKINFKIFCKFTFYIASSLYGIFGFLVSFIKELSNLDTTFKILILVCILFFSVIIGLFFITMNKSHTFIKRNNYSVSGRFDDLFKIANKKGKKIIVIPVNDTFETIIDTDLTIKKPLVSSNTIHGKWITYMQKNGFALNNLDLSISSYLKDEKYEEVSKTRGKTKSYSIGTIVPINSINETTFYLLVISKFDNNNSARSSDKEIRNALDSLFDFHNLNSQGVDIYIPLMGTGLSRTGLTDQNSLDLIRTLAVCKQRKLISNVIVVVHKTLRNRVSLF